VCTCRCVEQVCCVHVQVVFEQVCCVHVQVC